MVPDEVLRAQQRAVQVRPNAAIEVVDVDVHDVDTGRVDAGTVHEDVDVLERVDRLAEELLDVGFPADVGLHDDGATTLCFDLRLRLLRAGFVVQIVDDDVAAFTRELDRGGLSDTRVRSGDDRDSVFENSHVTLLLFRWPDRSSRPR